MLVVVSPSLSPHACEAAGQRHKERPPVNPRQLLVDAAVSPVAGYLATKAMEPVSMKLYELESRLTVLVRTPFGPARPTGSRLRRRLGSSG